MAGHGKGASECGRRGHAQHRSEFKLNFRDLVLRNPSGDLLEIDLAAGAEGVAFRYRFPEANGALRLVRSERTGFALPPDARGWMQPYPVAPCLTV